MNGNQNVGLCTASGVLAGGAVGGYLGVKKAPSIIGEIDIDKALEHTPYTDLVRDQFCKVGDATRDGFINARGLGFRAEEAAKHDTGYFFNLLGKSEGEKLTAKELKEAISSGKVKCAEDSLEQLGNYKKMLEKFDDSATFTKDELSTVLKKEHAWFKDAKKQVQEIIDTLPKQKLKYGIIIAAVGALVAGLGAYIISSLHAKNDKK